MNSISRDNPNVTEDYSNVIQSRPERTLYNTFWEQSNLPSGKVQNVVIHIIKGLQKKVILFYFIFFFRIKIIFLKLFKYLLMG